jgi:hypothetical protein
VHLSNRLFPLEELIIPAGRIRACGRPAVPVSRGPPRLQALK